MYSDKKLTRRDFLRAAGLTGAAAILSSCAPQAAPPAPAATQAAQAATPMPLKGTTIKAYLQDMLYQRYLQKILPEFEKQTGIKVQMEFVSFAVMLQQAEVELSSGSSSYDVMENIFIKAQRWMRAGWEAPLDDYIAKSKYDTSDFIPALLSPHSWQGKQYALPYLSECTQMIYRKDVLDSAGLKPPDTFDDLEQVLGKINKPPAFYGYVMRTQKDGVHFPFPIWLQGYGGNIFRNPPEDLTPTLNSDTAIKATQNFTDLILKYSIAGPQIYDTPDCQNAISQGKAGIWIDALGTFSPLLDPTKSKFADKMALALPPAGPAGRFPQIATHGFMIPKSSRNKDAAWQFIAWALSGDTMKRAAIEGNFPAVTRKSVLTSPEYARRYTIAGINTGDLITKALQLSKCAYRVVPEFPQIGARVGQAIGEILSKQNSVKAALDAAQNDAVQIMTAAGYKISP